MTTILPSYYVIQKQIKHNRKKEALFTLTMAIFLASLARYFWHFVAGYYFWGSYAPEGMSAIWYSFVVNGTTMILTFILCAIVLIALVSVSPRLIENKRRS